MQKINLRDLYPDTYKTDVFVDVAEEVLAAIRGHQQDDAAYERRKFRHKAHYSLNREDGIENDALNRPLTPEEILERKLLREEVYAALMKLPAIQARRIYARFYLGMTVAEIAQLEGTDRRRVWASIRRGLKKLARLLDTARNNGLISYVQYVQNGCVYFADASLQEYIAKFTHRAKPVEKCATYRKARSAGA